MISSEVQRTLVKSPPELWAEISDPEALARQLSELGEIRITRVEPERRVDWEAGDTSGTVVIKPSGWGTKVKLTVKHIPAQSEADAAQADPGEEKADTATALAQPPAAPVAAPGETELQDPAPGEIEAESELQPARQTCAPSPIDRPATHAGFALGTTPAAEDTAPDAAGAELEQELEAALGEGPADTDQESALASEAELDAGPQLEPRRGFFARLFGRRRQAPLADAAPDLRSPHEAEPAAEPEPAVEPEPALALEQAQPPEPAPGSEPYDALATWAPELRGQAEPQADPEDTGTEAGPAAQKYLATDNRPSAHEQAPELDGHGEPSPETAAGETAEDDPADARTAEEIAAEQVTAVLTGVLDRLGAAHHRPFSRA